MRGPEHDEGPRVQIARTERTAATDCAGSGRHDLLHGLARGYLGHFDPVSGKLLKEWASPGGAGSEPYGIAVTGIRSGTRWPGTQSTSPIGPATSSPFISTVAGSCVEQDLRLRQVPGAISRVSPAVDRDQLVIETFSVLTRNR